MNIDTPIVLRDGHVARLGAYLILTDLQARGFNLHFGAAGVLEIERYDQLACHDRKWIGQYAVDLALLLRHTSEDRTAPVYGVALHA